MPELSCRHVLDCDEETYWTQCVFDPDYNRTLYAEALKFPGYEILELSETADARIKRARIFPPVVGLAAPLKRLVGDKLAYVEEGRLDKKTRRLSLRITPSILADKTKTSGEVWCEPAEDGKIWRVAQIRVDVRVFGLGGMVEDKLLSDLRRSYDVAAEFTNAWLARRRSS
jgi:hypothetical protein